MEDKTSALKVIPLGGLGEIGLNMMVMEYEDSIIVVDCGLMFPEDYMLGIDFVIPDISYLIENKEKVLGFFITHGHEDHTGALPFVLKEVNAPVYGTALTLGLIEAKLTEHKMLEDTVFEMVRPRDTITTGPFSVEFLRVSHSIVDGCSLAITTPAGVVIHTGDFKIDQTPVDGEVIDYSRFSEYGERGVLALFSDSTNVEKAGYTLSEKEIGANIEEILRSATGRVILATFASHIHRMQQVFDASVRCGRKVILNGRSMVNNVEIAMRLGYLTAPDGLIADMKQLKNLGKDKSLLLTTGSQGEPMSALTRMAMNNHKQIKVEEGDTVILSSKLIPGNEKAITAMMNHLYKRGATVIYEKVSEIHVSGHASREELKIMLNMTRPKFFVPVHGEYRHLVLHSRLAQSVGIPRENIIVAEDGDVLEISAEKAAKTGTVDSGRVLVDGKGLGDTGDMVLKDRRHLARDGMVIALLSINEKTGELIYGPDIITRGFAFKDESPELLEGARTLVVTTLGELNSETKGAQLEVEKEIKRTLRKFFNRTIERRPVILPLVIEI
ncbi:MAG: ribonuclease J [Thermodesulfobacteriota bacterium]